MDDRIQKIIDGEKKGKYILYWMQQSQRTIKNDALNLAIRRGNELGLPVLVVFVIIPDFPDGNERHYKFMVQGLKDVEEGLDNLNIGFRYSLGNIPESIFNYIEDAAEIIVDKGYLKIQRLWRKKLFEYVYKNYNMNCFQVECDVLVPVRETSIKEEYSARTIRSKINKKFDKYFVDEEDLFPKTVWMEDYIKTPKVFINDNDIFKSLKFNVKVSESKFYYGGQKRAYELLNDFIENKIANYLDRNHPEFDYMSEMSPYLHFGQISILDILNRVRDSYNARDDISEDAYKSFLDEIVVRRELAINFVYYNLDYDQFNKMTYDWCYETMNNHRDDSREYIYEIEDFEACQTHDPYWNASMKELIITGKMHTYMRMYWCKKIIEWTRDYEEAYRISIELNNKYNLDGRDPNSYAGVAWCFGKHDRAWKERKVFGKLRYMNDNGLKRKFNMEGYLEKINKIKRS